MRPKSHMKKHAITRAEGQIREGCLGRHLNVGGWSKNTAEATPETSQRKCKMAAKNFYSFSALNLARSLALALSLSLLKCVCVCVGRRTRGSPVTDSVCMAGSSTSPPCSHCKVKLSDRELAARLVLTSISVHQQLIYYFMKMAK